MDVYGTDYAETLNADDGVTNGDDLIFARGGDDIIFALDGDDTILGGQGADTIWGGEGSDTAWYLDSHVGVMVSLTTGRGYFGTAQGDRLHSVENLAGSEYNDTLEGNAGDNYLFGDAGADTLSGGGGTNRLDGAAGNDTFKGGGGADNFDGGADIDTANYSDSPAGVFVLMQINHFSGGHAYEDRLVQVENLIGSNYDDHLWGTDRDANVLRGGRGNDSLKGYGGDDTLYGEIGNDVLDGGTGEDTMYGGAGADTFRFNAIADAPMGGSSRSDQIMDFSSAQGDKIDLSIIDANTTDTGPTAQNQAFTPIGVGVDFNDVAGELRYWEGHLEGDVDGDGNADFQIRVNVTLNASDIYM